MPYKNPKIKRFAYVQLQPKGAMHIAFSLVEGKAACGRFVPAKTPYRFRIKGSKVCEKCLKATETDVPTIYVQRVRRKAA